MAPATANSALTMTMGFRLDAHKHSDAGRLGPAQRDEPCAFVRLVQTAVLGPSVDQPAAALEDFARGFDLDPGGSNVPPALLDERPGEGFGGNGLIGHGR
jgi:hypothetical protein